MTNAAANLYEFGQFRLDSVKRLLLRDGEVVALPPKGFDILLTLVENSNRVVEKSELMDTIWPDSFVEEANITQNVSVLRKVLGERAGEHRYIVTVPGRGYRFVASVGQVSHQVADVVVERHAITQIVAEQQEEVVQEAIESEEMPAQETLSRNIRGARTSNTNLLIALALLVVLTGTGSYFLMRSNLPRPHSALEVRSVAVLPFKSLGAETRDEYLGLGMADTLITRMSNIRQLVVRPTSSVRKYADEQQDPLAAGREQRVEAVLDGSIHKAQGRIRVTARLINVQDQTSLWAGSFDEKYEDIFKLQDSIVERLAGALTLKLTGKEQQTLAKRYTENVEAYQAYLRGRYFWNKRTGEDMRKAIEQFQQAIDRDPNYALGYVGLADCYSGLDVYAGLPASETLPKARAAADRALQLDASLAEAHTSSALIYKNQWRWAEAEEGYKHAISLNPNYATAHQWLGYYYLAKRQFDDALRETKRALELDPLSPIINDQFALVHLLKNDFDSVVELCRRNLELHPSFAGTHYLLGSAYLKQKRYNEATAEFEKAAELSGRASQWLSDLGYCYAVTGKQTEANRIVEELEERYTRRRAAGQNVAKVYAGLGQTDQAFAWLEKSFEDRGAGLPFITSLYSYESLRSDPRYANLVRRMGLEP
jgi:DNA-binding winged helix-turn-helix (wHTH) protein/TolB-like protein/Flp pilus assembly protein TadD